MKTQTVRLLLLFLPLLPLVAIFIPAGWLHIRIPAGVAAISDWLTPAIIGVTFTTLGLLKVYGWKKGIIGGGGKPASCRLLGRCPSWSKQINITFIALFLGVGVTFLGIFFMELLKG
jgi:hypothetical protein